MAISALIAAAMIGQTQATPHSEASLIADVASFKAGTPFWAAVRVKIEKDWHIYWTNPGDTGEPTSIKWQVPKGWKVEPQRWLAPERVDASGITSYAYEDEAVFLAKITPSSGSKSGDLQVQANWLICKDVCLKASRNLKLSLKGTSAIKSNSASSKIIQSARTSLPATPKGWTFSARRQGDSVSFKGAHPSLAGSLSGAYFYASEAAVLDHAAAQTFKPGTKSFSVLLTESEFASTPAKRLRGVLVPPTGKTWPNGTKSLFIDIPIQ